MARCKGCGATIKWGMLFGKRHPFDLDGRSHFDSCPQADRFRSRGLRSLGDLDTHYRRVWRSEYLGDTSALGSLAALQLSKCGIGRHEVRSVAQALCRVGGPLQRVSVGDAHAWMVYGGVDATGAVRAVSVEAGIGYRLRDYLDDDFVGVYQVAGVYLAMGDFL